MNLKIEDLQKGINWWRKEKADKWPQDFHNRVYHELYDLRKNGLTERWWRNTVDRLWAWRAIRSKTPPPTQSGRYRKEGWTFLTNFKNSLSTLKAKSTKNRFFLILIGMRYEIYITSFHGLKTLHHQIFQANWGILFFQKYSGSWTTKQPE